MQQDSNIPTHASSCQCSEAKTSYLVLDQYMCDSWQLTADAAVLDKAYRLWRQKGGTEIETDLLERITEQASSKQWRQIKKCCRFRDVLYKASMLADNGQDNLLKLCKKVIQEQNKVDVEGYVELHNRIRGANGTLSKTFDKSDVEEAASRQLQHQGFAQQLAVVVADNVDSM